ncbi:MAG: DUF4159 domain-containing protein [Gammaproteobacteria bacterium]|jgi:hypothetical protein
MHQQPPVRRNAAPALLLCLAVLASSASVAQRLRRGYIEQNIPPHTELIVARWHFGTNGRIGHMGWSHNYPSSDQNFNGFIRNATGIDIEIASYRIVELGDPEVFDFPFAYVSEPGEMALTDQEVENLREFIDRGGFVLMDDFDGVAQLENMRQEVQRVFPDRPFFAVTTDHQVFDIHFELADLERMSPYVPGGKIVYFGMLNDRGELAIAAGHNNDLANFWDWYDEAFAPLEPAADAFRLGINMVIWSMTH